MKKILSVIGVIVLLGTIALSGCNEQKTPIISTFEVIPAVIELGNTTHLIWNVSDASSVTIDNGIGSVAPKGSINITPLQTTTYLLTAKASKTVTATTTIIVTVPTEQADFNLTQILFYLEITEGKNNHILQSDVTVIATNKESSEEQTTSLNPIINDGNGNTTFLGVGDIITLQNLSEFPVGETWDITLIYQGEIIGQCVFKNPPGPYDTPIVRMVQTDISITIIGIINGPINQQSCSITAINETSQKDQSVLLGTAFNDSDNDPTILSISDQIIFSNLGTFKAGDRWVIELVYDENIIGQCVFTNPSQIILIPPN